MKRKLSVIGILILLICFLVCGNIIHNIHKREKALNDSIECLNAGDYEKAAQLSNEYMSNGDFAAEYKTALKNKAGLLLSNVNTADDVTALAAEKGELSRLITAGYSFDEEDKGTLLSVFKEQYLKFYADGNDSLANEKLNLILEFKDYINNDDAFFKEQFNNVMSAYCSNKISKEHTEALYRILSFLSDKNSDFVAERITQIYTSYNQGNLKYELANNLFGIFSNVGIASDTVGAKQEELKKLYDSKIAYTNAVNAMNVNDYITAFDNFKKVISEDVNYAQKNTYVNSLIPKAKNYVLGQITTFCNAHNYDAARNIITKYDVYLNSQELRDKQSVITNAEKAYKESVEKQNKINQIRNVVRIRKVITSSPNSVGGVDLRIYWTNKSNKTIKYVNFYVEAYNAVNDVVVSEIGWEARECVKVTGPIAPGVNYGENGYWDCVWYNNTIKYAKVAEIKITYTDGTSVSFNDDITPYAVY